MSSSQDDDDGAFSHLLDSCIETLDGIIQLARSATVCTSGCKKLGLALSKPSLRTISKCVCTLIQHPDATGNYDDLLDELADLLLEAKYWLLSCQAELADGCAALHQEVHIASKLARVEVAVKSFATFDREQALQEALQELAELTVAQEPLPQDFAAAPPPGDGELSTHPGHANTARGAAGQAHPYTVSQQGVAHEGEPQQALSAGTAQHELDELATRLQLQRKARSPLVRCAGGPPVVATGVFQHIEALVPELAEALLSSKQIAIAGVAGIGKTTLAKAALDSTRSSFEAAGGVCIFLPVGQTREPMQVLQQAWEDLFPKDPAPAKPADQLALALATRLEQLGVSILLVLDNVRSARDLQLLNFVQLRGREGRQQNNRVVVTTDDPGILDAYAGCPDWKVVKLPALTQDSAHKLLCWHAFGTEDPPGEYEGCVQGVVRLSQGLPLVLRVVGAELMDQPVHVWRARIEALSAVETDASPVERMRRSLQPSVDALPALTRRCFTVLAAFEEGSYVPSSDLLRIFSAVCPFHASEAWARQQLQILRAKCLVSTVGEAPRQRAFAPDVLWDVACAEARQQRQTYDFGSCDGSDGVDPAPDGCDVSIESAARIVLRTDVRGSRIRCNASGARLLWLRMHEDVVRKTVATRRLQPPVDFHTDLESSGCRIMQAWRVECGSSRDLPAALTSYLLLQKLELPSWARLTTLPESIKQLRQLTHLNLGGCASLVALPASIGELGQLQNLNLGGCTSLATLPESISNLGHLQHLNVGGCKSLNALPGSIGRLGLLRKLGLEGCESLVLPATIGQLAQLQGLYLTNSRSLTELPDSIGELRQLQRLNLKVCTSLATLPDSLGQLHRLLHLYLGWCVSLTVLPQSIGHLEQLQHLDLEWCKSLGALPESIGQLLHLTRLDMRQCESLVALPDSIRQLSKLQYLNVKRCRALRDKRVLEPLRALPNFKLEE